MELSTQPTDQPELIDDLVNRIVSAVHPVRIVLFGSAARGSLGPDSDIDIMVVMPDGTHRLDTTRYLYRKSSTSPAMQWPFGIPATLKKHPLCHVSCRQEGP